MLSNINLRIFWLILIGISPLRSQAQEFLIPETIGAQYGGSIGYGSVNLGYLFFKEDKGSLDFSYGHIPESKGGIQNIGAIKFSYRPVNIKLKDWGVISPLNPGTFVSYDFGEDITRDDNQYPKGYYWWSPAIRLHLSVNTELKLNTKKLFKNLGVKNLSIYYELNTNDLYAVSWFINREQLSFYDILKSGYGVKMYF